MLSLSGENLLDSVSVVFQNLFGQGADCQSLNDADFLPVLPKHLGKDIYFDGFDINTCREMVSLMDVSLECHWLRTFPLFMKTLLSSLVRKGKIERKSEHLLSVY